MTASKRRVAVLISGRGSNLAALVTAAKERDFPAEISLVLSNRSDAAGLAHAQGAGIATAIVDHREHDRTASEHAMQRVLEKADIDIVCLAGFMRLLTPWFVGKWQNRMLNVHPALLPAFKGLHTHERALAAGVKIHGASVHFVIPEMDSGPIIAQGALAVHGDDTVQTLAARVLEIEHRIYPLALGLVAAGCVRLDQGRCVIDDRACSEDILIAPRGDRLGEAGNDSANH